ncbi:hypothetical protein EYF80_057029 [Liparis tanakae]|uniref:Uncharacterized protein n=1 Tax=Liparis tanakae TaxID=230148 RepID=A0A4Z2EVY5_9TELE|nr:hypothetical protein EYF80_057029 [Liparis tanakae]
MKRLARSASCAS